MPLGELTGSPSKLPVAPSTAPWGPRCCPNICSKPFALQCQYQLFTGAGPAPPGCSLVWSHRHPHVAALPRIKCHERKYDLAPSSGTEKSQPSCPKAGASHLKRVVKLAGLGERVSTVSVLSHICNCGPGRPRPPRPCRGSGGGSQRSPPLLSVRPASLCTDWLHRPEGSQGSPQQQRLAPAPGRQSRKCPHVTPRTQSSSPTSAAFPT